MNRWSKFFFFFDTHKEIENTLKKKTTKMKRKRPEDKELVVLLKYGNKKQSVDSSQTKKQQQGKEEEDDDEGGEQVDSFVPINAWKTIPYVRHFGWSRFQEAKDFAYTHKAALVAFDVYGKTKNYVVGPWSLIYDALFEKQLFENNGIARLCVDNPEALASPYEIIRHDQSVLILYDIEYYSNKIHGNECLQDESVLDQMSRSIAYLSSALLSELFPDQVVCSNQAQMELYSPPESTTDEKNDSETQASIWITRRLFQKHYVAPQEGSVPKNPIKINNDKHWFVFDASRGPKHSQHLILDSDAGLYFDTQVDHAIFVGLLYRLIYQAAFEIGVGDYEKMSEDDIKKFKKFRDMARSLFVTVKAKNAAVSWAPVIDDSVYKKSQLIRTFMSTKWRENRPFVYRDEVFPDHPASKETFSPKQILNHTLMGRIPFGNGVQSLSFARCYPGLFPKSSVFRATAHCSLESWKYVPMHLRKNGVCPPILPKKWKKKGKKSFLIGKPWDNPDHTEAVLVWLKRTKPTFNQRVHSYSSSLKSSGWLRKQTSSYKNSPASFSTSSGNNVDWNMILPLPKTAEDCIVYYIYGCEILHPWVEIAKSIQGLANRIVIKISDHVSKDGKRYKLALAGPNYNYCPKVKRKHDSGVSYLLIHSVYGTVSLGCLAQFCAGNMRLPRPMLREHLRLIFK